MRLRAASADELEALRLESRVQGVGAAGTEKCPEEPRLLSIRPIREPVESFGIRGPSGQEQLYA
jgi:hypothetical protein